MPPRERSKPTWAGHGFETYEKLVKAADELLGEIGFERLTSNAICARASVTHEALFREAARLVQRAIEKIRHSAGLP